MKILHLFVLFIFIFCIWSYGHTIVVSGSFITKIDGSSAIINAWKTVNPSTSFLQIYATYNNSSAVNLNRDDKNLHVMNTHLATSKNPSASTQAVIAWIAIDSVKSTYKVQARIATKNGWTEHSNVTLSSSEGDEKPSNEVQVEISDDGYIINVVWMSEITANHNKVIRANFSTDGGMTWSGAKTISPQNNESMDLPEENNFKS